VSSPIAQDPKRVKVGALVTPTAHSHCDILLARKISDTEEASVLTNSQRWGARKKRAKDKAEAAKAPKAEALSRRLFSLLDCL